MNSQAYNHEQDGFNENLLKLIIQLYINKKKTNYQEDLGGKLYI